MVTESRRRTSRLLVSKVTEADAGNYTCAPAESKTDSVTVHVIKGEELFTDSKSSWHDWGYLHSLSSCYPGGKSLSPPIQNERERAR